MRSQTLKLIVAAALGALIGAPFTAYAASSFDDVSDSSVFSADIAWLADNRVTLGCNPPSNTDFCPGEPVTREQMAAFMHRLATNQVVDAVTLEGKSIYEIASITNRLYASTSTASDIGLEPGDDLIVAAGCAVEFGEIVSGGAMPNPDPDIVLVGSYPDEDILDPAPVNYDEANLYLQRRGWTAVWRNIGDTAVVGDFSVVARCQNGGEALLFDLGN